METTTIFMLEQCSGIESELGAVYMIPFCWDATEAWDRFDVLQIAISCGTCPGIIVS